MTALPPPRFQRVARLLLRGERGDVVLGDLEEGYHRRLEAGASLAAARRWYLVQTLGSALTMLYSHEKPQRKRRAKGDHPMSQLKDELRHALQTLWRRPGFAVPIVLTLGVGMGVSATVFSVVEAVLISKPSFAEPERLVMLWNRQLEDTESSNLISGSDFADLRERSRTLSDIAAIDEVIVAPVVGTEQPSFARLGPTSANLFDVLGVTPLLGRLLNDADQTPLDDPQSPVRPPESVMISYNYWARTFDSDPDIVGRTIRTFTSDKIIVGVLPQDFTLVLPAAARVGEDLGAAIDIWSTYRTDYTQWDRERRALRLIGRLADDAEIGDVRGEMKTIAADLRSEHATHAEQGFDLDAEVLLDARSSHLRPLLLLLSAAVLCVLLVACVNASGLLLTRAVARSEELAVRSALGAGRFTLARLMLIESLMLALVGGLLGLVVALGGMELLEWLSPAGLPQAENLHLNRSVVLFAIAIVPVTAILAGLLPTLRATRKSGGLKVRAGTQSRGHRRLGEAMVAAQIALTVLLLVGTGLMLRSFYQLQRVPLGFEPASVLTVDISTIGTVPNRWSDTGFADWIERRRNQERALSRALNDSPGIEAAGAVFPVPLNGIYSRTCAYTLNAEGNARQQGVAYFRNVWPGFFKSLQIPLLSGRDFTYDDDQAGLGEWAGDGKDRTDTPRVILDARLAARLWPGENPVGRRLTFAIYPSVPHDAEVIGVVPFVPQGEIEDRMETIYIPRSYYRSQELSLTLRVASDTSKRRREIAETIHGIFPDSPVGFKPLDAYVGRALAPTRFVLTLLGVFAATALLLASMGLYGTMALMVRTRTNEFGLHMALGAPPSAIGKRVVLRAVSLSCVGAVVGLGAAFACSRFLSSYLVEVSATDPRVFGVAALVQVLVAVAAGWVPARRAAAVDPVTALRID